MSLLQVPELSFTIDPLPYVLRAVRKLRAGGLERSQNADDLHVHERQLFQIQHNPWPVPMEFPIQFLDVLRLKVTNQANRRSFATRFRLDLQSSRRLVFKLQSGQIAMQVPNEFIEKTRDKLRQKPETSGFLKVREKKRGSLETNAVSQNG